MKDFFFFLDEYDFNAIIWTFNVIIVLFIFGRIPISFLGNYH